MSRRNNSRPPARRGHFPWAHWLRTRRPAWFPSIRDLAIEAEMTPDRLTAIEQGNRPDYGEAVKIARAFGPAGQRFLNLLDTPQGSHIP
ncbi:MAG: helix-turn-helix transcriptional regulator [Sphingomonadales bacterium]|jgi:hypothetical protein